MMLCSPVRVPIVLRTLKRDGLISSHYGAPILSENGRRLRAVLGAFARFRVSALTCLASGPCMPARATVVPWTT